MVIGAGEDANDTAGMSNKRFFCLRCLLDDSWFWADIESSDDLFGRRSSGDCSNRFWVWENSDCKGGGAVIQMLGLHRWRRARRALACRAKLRRGRFRGVAISMQVFPDSSRAIDAGGFGFRLGFRRWRRLGSFFEMWASAGRCGFGCVQGLGSGSDAWCFDFGWSSGGGTSLAFGSSVELRLLRRFGWRSGDETRMVAHGCGSAVIGRRSGSLSVP